MTETSTKNEFLRDLAAASAVRLEIETEVAATDDGRTLDIGAPFTGQSMRNIKVRARVVASDATPGRVWAATGHFAEDGLIEFDSTELVPKGDESLRMSRTSRRIDAPDCEVRIWPAGEEATARVDCLDLSAGGAGVRIQKRMAISVGDAVEIEIRRGAEQHDLEGVVAYAEGVRRGSKLGVQFFPMEEAKARAYYAMLNELAGEKVAEMAPTPQTVTQFLESMPGGRATLATVATGDVAGEAFQLEDTAPESLISGAQRISVEADKTTWTADVRRTRGRQVAVLQVGRTTHAPPEVRASGYRVARPRGAKVTIDRDGDSSEVAATVVDLSRGGVGLNLPADFELAWMEEIQFRLAVPSTGLSEPLRGRVAYVRRDPVNRSLFAGVAFVGLAPSAREAIHRTLGRLEDREVIRTVIVFGLAVIVFLAALIVFGKQLAPERPAPQADHSTVQAAPD